MQPKLQPDWFAGKQTVGITAGASAPEKLVQGVIDRLRQLGAVAVRKMDGIEETVRFPLPKGLRLDGQAEQ
jgi:4-hydroxy-3-methylbut-2-enyl diphosphate reductase